MTTEYQGHLPNGNPVQQHSAGEYYPMVLFQRGLDADARYYILHDGVEYYMGAEQQYQIDMAAFVKDLSVHEKHFALLVASDEAANSLHSHFISSPLRYFEG